ncbi:hypothetical protein [Streptomyces fuscichromogenes]|uniref:Uncharacterized protein n=1 Tax=Streptomyces fuscichromogenes TaxID=1324013 RepID=A0A917XQG5_9ACTN|nr:hypothetical protein [Streptomyces fuscichromogenes]GGN45788.1 hypothetical protein GCM10011578_098050 [Streptomyces fuscichromogenes]
MSSTPLAMGTSGGTLAATIAFSFLMGALALYTLLHHREVFAWMKQIRKTDAEDAVYDEPDQWLADLYKAQCRRAKKPSRAEDMEDISQTGDMLRGVAGHIEAIRPELAKVVERVDDYLDTALPAPTPALKVSHQDHQVQLVQAMKQEAARAELAQAISSARQKITVLRRG